MDPSEKLMMDRGMPLTVAVVEDDCDLAEEVQFHLRKAGMAAPHAETAAALEKMLAERRVDVIVLDLSLPDEDGLSIARRFCGSPDMRIVMLTARASVLDRIQGFDAGADAYLIKPVNMQELVGVVQAVARRLPPRNDHLILDSKRGRLRQGQSYIELTGLETNFMIALARSESFRLSKLEIEGVLYPAGDTTAYRKLEVMLSRLRNKLKDAGVDDLVRTDWGRGFSLTQKVFVE